MRDNKHGERPILESSSKQTQFTRLIQASSRSELIILSKKSCSVEKRSLRDHGMATDTTSIRLRDRSQCIGVLHNVLSVYLHPVRRTKSGYYWGMAGIPWFQSSACTWMDVLRLLCTGDAIYL